MYKDKLDTYMEIWFSFSQASQIVISEKCRVKKVNIRLEIIGGNEHRQGGQKDDVDDEIGHVDPPPICVPEMHKQNNYSMT